jgi:hypothetical protein
MHNQITVLPSHIALALCIRVRDSLLDQAEMLPKDFVVLDKV